VQTEAQGYVREAGHVPTDRRIWVSVRVNERRHLARVCIREIKDMPVLDHTTQATALPFRILAETRMRDRSSGTGRIPPGARTISHGAPRSRQLKESPEALVPPAPLALQTATFGVAGGWQQP
jgi:hypothetical protein